MSWLLGSHLVDLVTPPEWQFVVGGEGDRRSFVLHHDALFALAWLLGLSQAPRPDRADRRAADRAAAAPAERRVVPALAVPDRSPRRATPPRPPRCSTSTTAWTGPTWRPSGAARRLPGVIDANAIGQRRWALEWAVVFRGPYHDPPAGWEEVDLST